MGFPEDFCRTAHEAGASKHEWESARRNGRKSRRWPRSTESSALARNGRARAGEVSSGSESDQGEGGRGASRAF